MTTLSAAVEAGARAAPTEAQQWILKKMVSGYLVLPGGGYQVHRSFYINRIWFVAPRSAYEACKRRGWIDHQNVTDAGRAALRLKIEEMGRP